MSSAREAPSCQPKTTPRPSPLALLASSPRQNARAAQRQALTGCSVRNMRAKLVGARANSACEKRLQLD